jgi:chemotaxis protein methyltransferase WspC
MKADSIVAQSVVERLTAAIGIDARVLEPARLEWIVAARRRELKLPEAAQYVEYLDRTPAELDALIDDVVVQETRFFRDPTVFEHVRRAIAELAKDTAGPIRVLSAPCGTGQEAYSVAALMQLCGVPATRFSIDAFDISARAVEAARSGVYPGRALHHVAAELRDACGKQHGSQVLVHEELRSRVHFERRNLAITGALGTEPRYHLILCRNLFIYLDAASRAELARSLAGALLPGGRLFLGTADRVEELSALFVPLRPAASFAFAPRIGAAPVVAERRRPLAKGLAKPHSLTPKRTPMPMVKSATALDAAPAPVTAGELYHRALEHRLRGEFAKAERRCRQSLYLSPNFLPALELLQALWDHNPNMRLRRALRERILRNKAVPA